MKKIFFAVTCIAVMLTGCRQADIQKNENSKEMTVREALSARHSVRSYDTTKQLTDEEIVDVLWAANGANQYGRRTAPSAMNTQDIDLYVCKDAGVWKYDAQNNKLDLVTQEDIRPYFISHNKFINDAPCCILIVTNQEKFRAPQDEAQSTRNFNFGLMDAGIVSENISLYCTSVGLGTVCCAPRMENDKIQAALWLTNQQIPVIYHPIGYPAE